MTGEGKGSMGDEEISERHDERKRQATANFKLEA
jgi:hypothetical protein